MHGDNERRRELAHLVIDKKIISDADSNNCDALLLAQNGHQAEEQSGSQPHRPCIIHVCAQDPSLIGMCGMQVWDWLSARLTRTFISKWMFDQFVPHTHTLSPFLKLSLVIAR